MLERQILYIYLFNYVKSVNFLIYTANEKKMGHVILVLVMNHMELM